MPGIAGIIQQTPAPERSTQVLEMAKRMRHERRWRCGHLEFGRLNLAAGWACRQGTFADCPPVWNEDRTVCLIFNGEEYSVGDELSTLKLAGHREVRDDASALVHWYEELDEEFFVRLNGWFSGLLVDLRHGTATLFNDRYGLSRVYCYESPEGFFFASEAKSLLSVLPHLREIDEKGLAEYFSCGCVLQNRSLFRDVTLLPGGSAWTFHRDGRVEKCRYFSPESWERRERLTPRAYGERLREVFGRVAPRYLRGRERVAMSLTGGLDSRMILAWAKAEPGELPCYTFGGPYRDCADVRIARDLARTCSQSHATLRVGEGFFKEFSSLAEETVYLTDGNMDVSGAVELYVNRRAREIAPVRLTGNYGSEILRSNVAFGPRRQDPNLFSPDFYNLIQEAEETYREEAAGNQLSFIAFKQVPWHHYSRLALEQSQLTLRSPFLDNELVALAYQCPEELAASPQPLLQLIAEGNPAFEAIRTDRAWRRGPASLLANLAHRWRELTAKAEYAYDYGMPDWLVRFDHFFKGLHLEKCFLGRHKFYHFRVWYRDQLASVVREILLDSRASGLPYLNERLVRAKVEGHLKGRCNFTLGIHRLLTVELIRRRLVEQN